MIHYVFCKGNCPYYKLDLDLNRYNAGGVTLRGHFIGFRIIKTLKS